MRLKPGASYQVDDIFFAMGEAGERLSAIEASEGAAGNLSVLYAWEGEPDPRFSDHWEIESPVALGDLGGAWIAITGSGRRLRECGEDPEANIALLEVVNSTHLRVHASPKRFFERPTSEMNTHLALHRAHAERFGPLHAVVHAQPLHLTFLSHIDEYREDSTLNQKILRWQPESIVQIPEGVGVVPYIMPGSTELMEATVELSLRHRLILWSRHGVVARAVGSVKKASDLIEYAETGARYEMLNLQTGERASGIPVPDLLALCETFGVEQRVFPHPREAY